MYKTGMAITNDLLATALFNCCDDDLMGDLMRDLQTNVSAMSESDLLAAIKRLAVKEESTLVHRIKLSKMTSSTWNSNKNLPCSPERSSLPVPIYSPMQATRV